MQLDLTLAQGGHAHLRLDDALTISFGPDLVYTLERGGRLVSVFRGGRHLRRGLDGRILARWRQGKGPRRYAWLTSQDSEAVLHELHADLERIHESRPPAPIAEPLQRALSFDHNADAVRFAEIYRPISILPPDQYQALVLQATEGCSFNTCTFCALYRDRPFRVKPPPEFSRHIADVRAFIGEGFRLRRSLFLADANALVVPQARLLPFFDEITRAFTIMPADLPANRQRPWLRQHLNGVRGVYAFVDGLSAERKTVEDFQALQARGLRRVYIGLESGSEALLRWLRKPSTAAAMLDAVGRMKQAGLQIGVIVLTGVGGERFHEDHCRQTASTLNAMPLDKNDIIYFSPFQPDERAPYTAIAEAEGIEPPTPELIQRQEQTIRAALTLPSPPEGPRRAPYNLRDFVY